MPSYTFECINCKSRIEKYLSISDFKKTKLGRLKCEGCDGGHLVHKIVSLVTNIERSNDQIILDIQEEVQKTVNKINNGDDRTIEDVYGNRLNPHKL
jgi:transcription elongation factor Elf1